MNTTPVIVASVAAGLATLGFVVLGVCLGLTGLAELGRRLAKRPRASAAVSAAATIAGSLAGTVSLLVGFASVPQSADVLEWIAWVLLWLPPGVAGFFALRIGLGYHQRGGSTPESPVRESVDASPSAPPRGRGEQQTESAGPPLRG